MCDTVPEESCLSVSVFHLLMGLLFLLNITVWIGGVNKPNHRVALHHSSAGGVSVASPLDPVGMTLSAVLSFTAVYFIILLISIVSLDFVFFNHSIVMRTLSGSDVLGTGPWYIEGRVLLAVQDGDGFSTFVKVCVVVLRCFCCHL